MPHRTSLCSLQTFHIDSNERTALHQHNNPIPRTAFYPFEKHTWVRGMGMEMGMEMVMGIVRVRKQSPYRIVTMNGCLGIQSQHECDEPCLDRALIKTPCRDDCSPDIFEHIPLCLCVLDLSSSVYVFLIQYLQCIQLTCIPSTNQHYFAETPLTDHTHSHLPQ